MRGGYYTVTARATEHGWTNSERAGWDTNMPVSQAPGMPPGLQEAHSGRHPLSE